MHRKLLVLFNKQFPASSPYFMVTNPSCAERDVLHAALMQDVGSSLFWKQHIMTSHSSLHLLMTIGSYFRDVKAENLTQDHKWN